jgi:hypothetical protein
LYKPDIHSRLHFQHTECTEMHKKSNVAHRAGIKKSFLAMGEQLFNEMSATSRKLRGVSSRDTRTSSREKNACQF